MKPSPVPISGRATKTIVDVERDDELGKGQQRQAGAAPAERACASMVPGRDVTLAAVHSVLIDKEWKLGERTSSLLFVGRRKCPERDQRRLEGVAPVRASRRREPAAAMAMKPAPAAHTPAQPKAP